MAGGDAATNSSCEGEERGGKGSQATGGAVSFEKENPSDLLSVFILPPFGYAGAGEGIDVSVIRRRDLHHGPVRVFHLHHHRRPPVLLVRPPTERRRHCRKCEIALQMDQNASFSSTMDQCPTFLQGFR